MIVDDTVDDDPVLDADAARARLDRIRSELGARRRPGRPAGGGAGWSEEVVISYEMELAAHRDRMEAQITERNATIDQLRAENVRLRQILAGITGQIAEAFVEADQDR